MGRVVIGMDPHQRSSTIEVFDATGWLLDTGIYGTDNASYGAMLAAGRRFTVRSWAGRAATASADTSPLAALRDGKRWSTCRQAVRTPDSPTT